MQECRMQTMQYLMVGPPSKNLYSKHIMSYIDKLGDRRYCSLTNFLLHVQGPGTYLMGGGGGTGPCHAFNNIRLSVNGNI